MELNNLQMDLLKSIDNGVIINKINTNILDINGNPAIFLLDNLKNDGYIDMRPSGTGLGESIVTGLTEKGKLAIKST